MVVLDSIGTWPRMSAQPPSYSNSVRVESITRYWMPGTFDWATSALR